jgi:hypothetical protein
MEGELGMRRGCFLVLAVYLAHAATALAFPDRVELVGPTAQIPRSGYTSWALFLVCTPDWVTPDKSKDLANLYRRFSAFGDAIGDDNLAVWFWKSQTTLGDAKLSENVDVRRSADYCRALSLRPSEGPFLVVTNMYPALNAFPKDRAVFVLGALPPAELATLLNKVTDHLLLDGTVTNERTAPTPATTSSRFWLHLLESTRQSIIGFGCAVKMQVSAGVVSAELRGCAG